MFAIQIYAKDTVKSILLSRNGHATLNNILKCVAHETLNGESFLEVEYSTEDTKKARWLKKWNLIKAGGQIYRIAIVKEDYINKIITVRANAIFYDLDFCIIEDLNAEGKTVKEILDLILTRPELNEFVGNSDKTGIMTLKLKDVAASTSIFEIIKKLGNVELVRNNYNVALQAMDVYPNHYEIRYKKNMLGLIVEENIEPIATRLYPRGKDNLVLPESFIEVDIVDAENIPPKPISKVATFDADTEEKLREMATEHAKSLALPFTNVKCDLIEAGQDIHRFVNIQAIKVREVVQVVADNFKLNMKCVRVSRDLLNNLNTQIELGAIKPVLPSLESGNTSGGGDGGGCTCPPVEPPVDPPEPPPGDCKPFRIRTHAKVEIFEAGKLVGKAEGESFTTEFYGDLGYMTNFDDRVDHHTGENVTLNLPIQQIALTDYEGKVDLSDDVVRGTICAIGDRFTKMSNPVGVFGEPNAAETIIDGTDEHFNKVHTFVMDFGTSVGNGKIRSAFLSDFAREDEEVKVKTLNVFLNESGNKLTGARCGWRTPEGEYVVMKPRRDMLNGGRPMPGDLYIYDSSYKYLRKMKSGFDINRFMGVGMAYNTEGNHHISFYQPSDDDSKVELVNIKTADVSAYTYTRSAEDNNNRPNTVHMINNKFFMIEFDQVLIGSVEGSKIVERVKYRTKDKWGTLHITTAHLLEGKCYVACANSRFWMEVTDDELIETNILAYVDNHNNYTMFISRDKNDYRGKPKVFGFERTGNDMPVAHYYMRTRHGVGSHNLLDKEVTKTTKHTMKLTYKFIIENRETFTN